MKRRKLGSVTLAARVGIYLAFAASIVVLLYLAGTFIYALVNAEAHDIGIASNLYLLPEAKEAVGTGVRESAGGAVRFRLDEVYGMFTWLNMPRRIVFAVYAHLFILWFLFFLGVRELANVFEEVGEGRPFAAENARRLRIVGLCMSGGGLFKILYTIVSIAVFYDDVLFPGARLPWKFLLTEDLNLGLIFGGLVVLAVSEVFRAGNRLDEEQKLTV